MILDLCKETDRHATRFMNNRINLVLALLATLIITSGCEQGEPEVAKELAGSTTEEMDQMKVGLAPRVRINGQTQTLEERLKELQVPGVSMAILRNGELAWTLESGVRDIATGVKVDSDTVFQAASISKPTFATVLMKYRQDNALDLDVDVNELLTSWKLPEHVWTGQDPVSLRRLLSHTAGTTVHGFPGYSYGSDVPTLQQVLDGEAPANTDEVIADIQPGLKYRYSGGGTTIAQLTLQDVTGVHLTEMAKELLFDPLNMSRTGYYQPINEGLSNNMSAPHNGDGTPVTGGAHTYATLAAAGMWTTPTDLLKLVSAVRGAYLGINTSLLSEQTAKEMLARNASLEGIVDVGIGFFLVSSDDGELKGFGHGGSNEGFISTVHIDVESGDGYAIMTNSNNGGQLITELEIRISEVLGIGELKPIVKSIVDIGSDALSEFTGNYYIERMATDVTLAETENGFSLTALPYRENQMYWHEGDGVFFALDGTIIKFERDDDGKITTMVISDRIRADRVD